MPVEIEIVKLEKILKLPQLISIGISGLVGIGIFISPVGILMHAGSLGASVVVWVLAGLCQILIALCYAELGCRIPLSGSDYIYFSKVFGGLMACIRLWSEIISYSLAMSVFSHLFAIYTVQPFYKTCDPNRILIVLLFFVAIGFTVGVNCYSVKLVAKIQMYFSVAKVAALLLVFILGCIALAQGYIGQLSDPFAETSRNVTDYALAFYSGVWGLSGWEYLTYVVGEVKNPKRDLRIALVLSIGLTTVIYIFANIAYGVILTKEEMLASPAVAVSFADKTMGPVSFIIQVFVACSVLGSAVSCVLAASRMFLMAAKNGHLPFYLCLIHVKLKTPLVCLQFLGILGIISVLFENVFYVMELCGFLLILFQALAVIALIKLRRTDTTERKNIAKAPFAVPQVSLIIQVSMLSLTIYERPVDSGILLFVIIVCFTCIYKSFVMWDNKPTEYYKFRDNITIFLQKLTFCIPEEF